MKIRSKALYTYLFENGVLSGTPEEIARAKCEYRKLYKQRWKKHKRPVKEIRYAVTLKQFAAIRTKAQSMAMKHTVYAKQALLEATGQPMMPSTALLEVLQAISMASIAIEHNQPVYRIRELVRDAELKILHYLKV